MATTKRLLNTPLEQRSDVRITIDGAEFPATSGEPLVEAVNRALRYRHLPQACYLPQMGPIQTCDTCMVEVDGELVRAVGKLLGSFDLQPLSEMARKANEAMEQHKKERAAPSMWELFRRMRQEDTRRGLGFLMAMLEALGRATR